MNYFLLAAGAIAAATTLGHFTVGARLYLRPTLEAPLDPVARKIMHCLFHYSSVALILATSTLLYLGYQGGAGSDARLLVLFLSAQFALFGIWQLWITLTSEIQRAPLKLFQWTFFAAISVLALLGA